MRAVAHFAWATLLAGCAGALLLEDHPLAGRVWDVRGAVFIAPEQMFARSAAVRHVILGETHDNPEHHRLQFLALDAIAARGGRRALAMEQFDSEQQTAMDDVRAKGADAETLATAGRFDRKGWNWPFYRPLVEFAVTRGWPLIAANLSRESARSIIAHPAGTVLPPASAELRAALERDLIDGHCGQRPEAKRLAGMVAAQRARDARMARQMTLSGNDATVLITGLGHARKDRGVPLYFAGSDVLSIAFVEVEPSRVLPSNYVDGFATAASFDYLWFTPRAARADPCARPS